MCNAPSAITGREPRGLSPRMGGTLAALLWLLTSGPWPASVWGQTPGEISAFDAAARAFDDGIFDRAERELAEFVQRYPESPKAAEAILLRARAALQMKNTPLAVSLLETNLSRAGPLADRYRYFVGQAHMRGSNYQAAAESFALLIREFTNSSRLLEASYQEALARYHLNDWSPVIALLQAPDGTFQQQASVRPTDEFAVRGRLLLGEALLERKAYRAAEAAVASLPEPELIPEFKWRRQYLLCRIRIADERLDEALANTTNLLALAIATGQREFQAESVALQGSILEQLNELESAVQTLGRNLDEAAPAERRRQALLKIIELSLAQNQLGEAARRLETFFAKYPADAITDLALLTYGELHLKKHYASLTPAAASPAKPTPPVAGTNYLQSALTQFDKLIADFPQSSLLGKALLDKGWCLWSDGKIAEAVEPFRLAAEKLSYSEDQAVARFKLADAQFYLKDYTNALRNYRAIIDQFAALPRVKSTLFDQALYQIVRASLELNELAPATEALRRILDWYPESFFSDRSMLLVGQRFTLLGQAAEARAVFAEFATRFPQSALRPEVELAVARSYLEEQDWPAAILRYDGWISRFPTNELRPRAEFNRAWVNARAGRETNALTLFTNFLARFPTHELAARAQDWVANFYYRHKDFVNAELQYQRLFQSPHWPVTPLTYQARLMAGRCAFSRQSYKDAYDYFTNLFNVLNSDTNAPTDLVCEAYFALGDTLTEGGRLEPNQPLDSRFGAAINAFNRIIQDFPTTRFVPLAWGRVGDCHFQLARQDPIRYQKAAEAYQRVLASPLADITARSQAEVALGQVLEKQAGLKGPPDNAALVKQAFDHYYNIVSGKNLREGEKPDPVWLNQAGMAAARLAEEQGHWEVAVNIYNRLLKSLPPLRRVLEKRIERAREQLRSEGA